jgi:barstar (barnase inhibitor)
MDLVTLLHSTAHNGVYHLPPGRQEGLAQAAAAAELGYFPCDLAEDPNLEAALVRIGNALAFPEWYGVNFDALQDCLTDLSWHESSGWVLLLAGGDALQSCDGDGFATLLAVLRAAAEYWQEQEVPFWVFLDMRADGLADLPTVG